MWKLVWSNLVRRPGRTFLTAAAVALSVALVVSTTTGYKSAEASLRQFVTLYLGTSDFRLGSGVDTGGLPGSLLDDLRVDPDVQSVFGRYEVARQFADKDGKPTDGQFNVLGVDPARDDYFSRLPLSDGTKFTAPDAREALLDQGAQRTLGVEIGDTINLPGPDGPTPLKVVGLVHKPEIVAALVQSVYVPLRTLQTTVSPEAPDRLTKIVGEYKLGTFSDEFLARWTDRLQAINGAWEIAPIREQRDAFDNGLRGMNLLSLLGGMVSLLAATFIVFGTLSMGVAERGRTLAMLRSVGATRAQVAWSVVGEGTALAGLGVLVGVPLGLLFIFGLTRFYAGVFTAGVAVGWLGLGVAVGGMFVASLAASLLPAWNAGRVDPLSAMRPDAGHARVGPPWPFFVAGLLLIAVDSLLLWPPVGYLPVTAQFEKDARFWLHFAVGLPTLMLGFFLVAPMVVWLVERTLAPATALLFGVQPALLRQQLSAGLWRAAGTAAALMVGLAVLIVMNTQGKSSIDGWQLPDNFPDVFLFDFSGITPDDLAAIGESPSVAHLPDGTADLTPIGYFNPLLGDNPFALAGAAFTPDRTMFVAVDPRRVFSLMDLQFTRGDTANAQRMMERGVVATLDDGTTLEGTFEDNDKTFLALRPGPDGKPQRIDAKRVASHVPGRYLLITQEFRQLRGTDVGDPFVLEKPGKGFLGRLNGEPVTFTVAGVVQSPGIDVMVATYDLGRQFQSQSAASVFGTIDDARDIFGMTQVRMVAANLVLGVDKKELVAKLSARLGKNGISVADVRQLKADVQGGLRDLLTVASVVAWSAMAVASLGVVNTIMAGVRVRRYQLGILRAIGVTRGEVVRLVLAEAVLLGLVACVLGVGAGLLMSENAQRLQAWVVGYVPPLRVAWDVLWLGVGVVMAVSVVAALYPAVTTARTAVLRLLQAGRAAT